MATPITAGARFRKALAEEKPLQIMGTINAYCAMMAERVGYRAIYLSGGGVANASYGLPDLGMTSMNDVLEDVRRISSATEVPLLVDIDTGWGGAFNISRTVKEMIKAGAGAVHLEDQVAQKRCGHRPNKEIVSKEEMVDRIKAAVDGKTDDDFFIMPVPMRSRRKALRPPLIARVPAWKRVLMASSRKRYIRWKTIRRLPRVLAARTCSPISPSLGPRPCSIATNWPPTVRPWSCIPCRHSVP